MRAMILAAGLGTRLGPLTADRPKALVEINGRSLLEIALARLRSFGIKDVIVNVHHFADKVVDHLQAHANFGMNIAVSREEILLDTGGGLKKTAWFFLQESNDEPFVVHNVDVLSSIDLERMVEAHRARKALVTLAVQGRDTSRHLLFDEHLRLCKRELDGTPGPPSCSQLTPLGFCGVHVISPRIFALMSEEGVFSIIPAYLRLAAEGERIVGFRADEYYWRDLGTADSLSQAAHDLQDHILLQ
ncbi:MAG TPA: nucleotidyltransferase family protein [Terriglobales bacterium]